MACETIAKITTVAVRRCAKTFENATPADRVALSLSRRFGSELLPPARYEHDLRPAALRNEPDLDVLRQAFVLRRVP